MDLARESEALERASPEERVAFAVATWGDDLLFTSSFGAQSAVLLHLWSRAAPDLPVTFVDTGFLFPETHAYKDALTARLGLRVRVVAPEISRDAFMARWGDDIQRRDPDACCAANKVSPLEPLRASARAWLSGLRRDQGKTRQDLSILEQDGHLVRVHPLATMTSEDVARYLADHDLPRHPLEARRYLSIGCTPCTRAVAEGEDERAGRWAWTTKTECGLHPRSPRRP